MIHVDSQLEPATFDEEVRQKGLADFKKRRLNIHQPLPSKTKISNFWLKCSDDLCTAYNSTCAYLGIRLTFGAKDANVDHFLPAHKYPHLAYEWSNYRLAQSRINTHKSQKIGILDPFEVENGWFYLDLLLGIVSANPSLQNDIQEKINYSIKALHINDSDYKNARIDAFNRYLEMLEAGADKKRMNDRLKHEAPFVWHEASRQGLI